MKRNSVKFTDKAFFQSTSYLCDLKNALEDMYNIRKCQLANSKEAFFILNNSFDWDIMIVNRCFRGLQNNDIKISEDLKKVFSEHKIEAVTTEDELNELFKILSNELDKIDDAISARV